MSDAYDNVYAVSDLTTDSDKVYQLYFEYYRLFLLGKYNGIANRTQEETCKCFFKLFKSLNTKISDRFINELILLWNMSYI